MIISESNISESNPRLVNKTIINLFIFYLSWIQEDRRPDLPESPLHYKYKNMIVIKFLWMRWSFVFRLTTQLEVFESKEFNWIDKLKCFFMNIYYYLEHNLGKLTKKEKT